MSRGSLPGREFLRRSCDAIDVMHLMKNFCVNLITFLGVYGKTKDTVEARQELQRMEERDALHPQQ